MMTHSRLNASLRNFLHLKVNSNLLASIYIAGVLGTKAQVEYVEEDGIEREKTLHDTLMTKEGFGQYLQPYLAALRTKKTLVIRYDDIHPSLREGSGYWQVRDRFSLLLENMTGLQHLVVSEKVMHSMNYSVRTALYLAVARAFLPRTRFLTSLTLKGPSRALTYEFLFSGYHSSPRVMATIPLLGTIYIRKKDSQETCELLAKYYPHTTVVLDDTI